MDMLTLREVLEEYRDQVIGLELREARGVLPVIYHAERRPFLRFRCADRLGEVEVRAEYYGKTWRCWNGKPDPLREWPDEEVDA